MIFKKGSAVSAPCKMADLSRRFLSSLLLISSVVLIIFVMPGWAFLIAALVAAGLALYEFFKMVEKKGIEIYKYVGIAIGSIIIFTTYIKFETTRGWELFFMAATCLSIFVMQITRRDSSQAIASISTTLFGILYVAWMFSFLVKLKLLPDGEKLVAYLLLVTKCGDMGAYFLGTALGKHPLIKRISPKKTIEGFIGGIIFSLIFSLLSHFYLPQMPVKHLIVLGVLLGALAQVGDLCESLIKRDSQVKDSGTLAPGLGGMLDLIDSILFTAPIFYFYLKFLV